MILKTLKPVEIKKIVASMAQETLENVKVRLSCSLQILGKIFTLSKMLYGILVLVQELTSKLKIINLTRVIEAFKCPNLSYFK